MAEEQKIIKINIPCSFSEKTEVVSFYIGQSEKKHNPIHFQAEWLSKERGGTVPSEVMKSLEELKELSVKNGANFQELCSHALKSFQPNQVLEEKVKEFKSKNRKSNSKNAKVPNKGKKAELLVK